jgi:hypothetical protein
LSFDKKIRHDWRTAAAGGTAAPFILNLIPEQATVPFNYDAKLGIDFSIHTISSLANDGHGTPLNAKRKILCFSSFSLQANKWQRTF